MENKLNCKYYNNQVSLLKKEAAILQTLIRVYAIQHAKIGTSVTTKKKDNHCPCISNSCGMWC